MQQVIFKRNAPQRLKENAIERIVYNICVADEISKSSIELPAFVRAKKALEMIKALNMVNFYYNNRKRLVTFCRRYKI